MICEYGTKFDVHKLDRMGDTQAEMTNQRFLNHAGNHGVYAVGELIDP